MYGQELILDLHECGNCSMDLDLQGFCEALAELIHMETEDYHEWKSEETDVRDVNTYGISCIQFIITSNITIHVLPLKRAVYINLFSCKEFDVNIASRFCEQEFRAEECVRNVVERQ